MEAFVISGYSWEECLSVVKVTGFPIEALGNDEVVVSFLCTPREEIKTSF